MTEVHERLHVGNEYDCRSASNGWAVAHACKHPCHASAVGYSGSLKPDHPNYLWLENGDDLYLNMIDPPAPLFKLESFLKFLSFADERWKSGRQILIHCNRGESRAPSLALVFLAKKVGAISNESYDTAREGFQELYPSYSPGKGIQMFLTANWGSIA